MKLEGRESILEDNFRHNTRLWRMRKGLPQRTISKLLGHGKTNIINSYESNPIMALDQATKQRYADILGNPDPGTVQGARRDAGTLNRHRPDCLPD